MVLKVMQLLAAVLLAATASDVYGAVIPEAVHQDPVSEEPPQAAVQSTLCQEAVNYCKQFFGRQAVCNQDGGEKESDQCSTLCYPGYYNKRHVGGREEEKNDVMYVCSPCDSQAVYPECSGFTTSAPEVSTSNDTHGGPYTQPTAPVDAKFLDAVKVDATKVDEPEVITKEAIYVFIAVAVLLIVVCCMFGVVLYRKKRTKQNIRRGLWCINKHEGGPRGEETMSPQPASSMGKIPESVAIELETLTMNNGSPENDSEHFTEDTPMSSTSTSTASIHAPPARYI